MAVNISEISVSVNSDCTVISKYNLYEEKILALSPPPLIKVKIEKKRKKHKL